MSEVLLKIKNMKVSLNNSNRLLQIIRGFDLEINEGEVIGILGESGSGKTVSSSMIAQIYGSDESNIDSGEIIYKGTNLVDLNEIEMNKIRGKQISYIFQNPSNALNPYKKVGKQLEDLMKTHDLKFTKTLILNAMEEVGLTGVDTVYDMFPFQLSGGQNQRIMICQSILCKPELLIADEPTSSIDAMLRKKILDLLITINRKYNMAVIFITHDFDVAKYLCDRLVIMYGGLVVEEGSIKDIFNKPQHPYTEELIKCASSLDTREEFLYSLEGSPLIPADFKDECPFYYRCRYRVNSCKDSIPEMIITEKGKTRCPVRNKKEE